MAKTRTRTSTGQFTKRSSGGTSTALVRSNAYAKGAADATKAYSRGRSKGSRGRGRGRGHRRAARGAGIQNKMMHWGWALLAFDFAKSFNHEKDGSSKLPIIVKDAGEEGSLALAAYLFDADKYVPGIEDVSIILALERYFSTQALNKPKEGGGFGL